MARRTLSILALSVAASGLLVLAADAPSAAESPAVPPGAGVDPMHTEGERELRLAKALELAELKALAQLVTERHRAALVEASRVSPAEVRRYYEAHQQGFIVEPRFTAHHLLVYVEGNPAFPEKGRPDAEARARAEAALAKLRAGEHWDSVAPAYSDEVVTSQRGGLLRDAQFGYFAPEVEQAVKTQPLGSPAVVRSAFGYHVIEVVERVTERTLQPFEQVEAQLTERLGEERQAEAREAFMGPLRKEIGLELLAAGEREGALLDERRAAHEILARVGGTRVSEGDFRWFVKDALAPGQRASADARPGARQSMLRSYLDLLVLAAKARNDGLDRTPEFAQQRELIAQALSEEFTSGACGSPEPG